jgi:hypothetical protein
MRLSVNESQVADLLSDLYLLALCCHAFTPVLLLASGGGG